VAAAAAVAVSLVPATNDTPTFVAAASVGVLAIGIVLATAPIRASWRQSLDALEEDVPRGQSIRRLVFDGLVIVLAIAAAWLPPRTCIRGASSATALAAADPLIAAVPVLAGVAAGLILVRLAPIPLRALGRVAGRGRGLVPVLALRHAAQGGTTTAILIVLLLAASIGAFSHRGARPSRPASTASSWQEIGAPFRVTALIGPLPSTLDLTHVLGVRTAATVFQALVAMGEHRLRPRLLAVDLAAYESITAGVAWRSRSTPGDARRAAAARRDPGARVGVTRRPTGWPPRRRRLPDRRRRLSVPVRVVGVRRTFPTVDAASFFAIVNREQLKAIHSEALLGPSINAGRRAGNRPSRRSGRRSRPPRADRRRRQPAGPGDPRARPAGRDRRRRGHRPRPRRVPPGSSPAWGLDAPDRVAG
jgi:putative ABC transport system permease protein